MVKILFKLLVLVLLISGCVVEVDDPDPTPVVDSPDEDNNSGYTPPSSNGGYVDPCPPTPIYMYTPDGELVVFLVPGLCSEYEMRRKGPRPDPPPFDHFKYHESEEYSDY